MTTPPLTDSELKTLAELEAKGSPAPFETAWFAQRDPICIATSQDHDGTKFAIYAAAFKPTNIDTDMDLLCAARNALPRLLADLAAAREEVKQLRDDARVLAKAYEDHVEYMVACEGANDPTNSEEYRAKDKADAIAACERLNAADDAIQAALSRHRSEA